MQRFLQYKALGDAKAPESYRERLLVEAGLDDDPDLLVELETVFAEYKSLERNKSSRSQGGGQRINNSRKRR